MGARGSTARSQTAFTACGGSSRRRTGCFCRAIKGSLRGGGAQYQAGDSHHEAGRDGFWLALFLVRRDVEVHVMQPSSLPVDRRARRAKTDVIDVEMLLRTLMAWLRGEPRVCSMVPIPNEADEEARRAHREREELT